MSPPVIGVHFSPDIIAKIGTADTSGWADAFRDWFYNKDPNRNFGRDVSNSSSGKGTYAWHLHFAPDEQIATEKELDKWNNTPKAYYRTSDQLVVYSMDKAKPVKYGILLLAFLTPNGHAQLTTGPSAAERRARWEDIAYTHQMNGSMPDGTISEP